MYFFAYGTLQPGSNLKYFEENELSKFLIPFGAGAVVGDLFHLRNANLDIEYPGMTIALDPTHRVRGSVFQVPEPEHAFRIMDEHELFTSEPGSKTLIPTDLYTRREVEVYMDKGSTLKAQAYLFNPDSAFFKSGAIKKLGTILSGDWLSYIKR